MASLQSRPGFADPFVFTATQAALRSAQSLSQLASLLFGASIEKQTKPPCATLLSPAVFSAAQAEDESNRIKRST
jgi:hypothetical protein